MYKSDNWKDFKGDKWRLEINMRDFIQNNYNAYNGNKDFLSPSTKATDILWEKVQLLQKKNMKKMVFLIWKQK